MTNQQHQYYWYEQMRRRNSLLATKVGFGGDDEPLPKYMVTFNNFFGNEINAEMVEQGKSATAPQFNDDDFREYEQDLGGNTFKFKGWDKDFSNITSVTNVNSVYEADSQHVVIDAEPLIEGTGTVTGVGVYEVGQQITLQAVPAQDFTFVQWDDGENMNPRVMTAAASMPKTMFLARFVPHTQIKTVAVTCDETKGTVTGGGTYVVDETATVEATPNSGYEFEKWSDDTTEAIKSFAVTEDVSLTAYFKVAVVKPFTVNGVSYETLNDAITNCEAGSTIEMTCDYDCNSTQTINKDITLDCNGNHFKPNTDISNKAIAVTEGKFTFKNATVNGKCYYLMNIGDGAEAELDNINADDICGSSNAPLISQKGKLTIKNSNLKYGSSQSSHPRMIGGYTTSQPLVIENCSFDATATPYRIAAPNLDTTAVISTKASATIKNTTIKGVYCCLGVENTTAAQADIIDSTLVGGNGWNAAGERYAIHTSVNARDTVSISGNTVVTGGLIAQGKNVTVGYSITNGTFNDYKAYGGQAGFPPSSFYNENYLGATALKISAGRFTARPRESFWKDHSCTSEPDAQGYYVVS